MEFLPRGYPASEQPATTTQHSSTKCHESQSWRRGNCQTRGEKYPYITAHPSGPGAGAAKKVIDRRRYLCALKAPRLPRQIFLLPSFEPHLGPTQHKKIPLWSSHHLQGLKSIMASRFRRTSGEKFPYITTQLEADGSGKNLDSGRNFICSSAFTHLPVQVELFSRYPITSYFRSTVKINYSLSCRLKVR